MTKEELINGLASFKQRLTTEVIQAYQMRGSQYGGERFSAWKSRFKKFIDQNFPKESMRLDSKLNLMVLVVETKM